GKFSGRVARRRPRRRRSNVADLAEALFLALRDPSQSELASRCRAAAAALEAAVGALGQRLERERELAREAGRPSAELQAAARAEDGLTKEQRREKAIFDGQQDFGWDTGLEARVGRRREHLQRAFAEAVAEAEGALQGRRRGVRDHERAAAFGRLQELDERVRSAEAEAEAVLREAEASVAREAAELEADRRRVHEQVQALFAAAAIVRQEKAKLAEVYYAPAKRRSGT
ncbi:unnamed protein product, partial [Prorocentrum cordatum]